MNLFNQVVQDQIDLLAENELDVDQRDALFDRLDRDPDGWKRCALALLEQRALQASISDIANSSPQSIGYVSQALVKTSVVDTTPNTELQREVSWSRFMGLAATAMLLVASGWLLGLNSAERAGGTIADIPTSTQERQKKHSNSIEPELMRQVQAALAATGAADMEILALVGIGESENRKIYPVIRSDDLSRKMIELPKPKVPADVARQMHRSGWRLETHQQFVSLQLPNGQRETLPVGMLNYRFVGRNTY